jgi:hypothetical protein
MEWDFNRWKLENESNDSKRNFPTIESKLNFNHKIDSRGNCISHSTKKEAILNNNYEFYQGATLGGDYD